MNRSELFHVGIVVSDLQEARTRLTGLLGVTWGPIIGIDALEVRDEHGRHRAVPSRICYSTEPPYLELIAEAPGTVWTCNEHSNLHHIGFFSSDLAEDAGALSAAGCPVQLTGWDPGGAPSGFSYHRDALGVRIELVDAAMRTTMEATMFVPGD